MRTRALIAVAILTLGACGAVIAGPEGDANVARYIQLSQDLQLPIENRWLVFDIGQSLPLLQKNDRYFVAIVTPTSGPPFLAAFPRLNNVNKGTGWITYEREIVFGASVQSCPGAIFLKQFDRLPLVSESDQAYTVTLERNGQKINIDLAKSTSGIELISETIVPAPSSSALARARRDSSVYQMPLTESRPEDAHIYGEISSQGGRKRVGATSSGEIIDLSSVSARDVGMPALNFGERADEKPAPAAGEEQAVASADAPQAAGEPASAQPVEVAGTEAAPAPDAAAQPVPEPAVADAAPSDTSSAPVTANVAPGSPPFSWLAFLSSGSLVMKILLGTVIVEGLMLVYQRRKTNAPAARDISKETVAEEKAPDTTPAATMPKLTLRSSGDLSGTLDAFSMGQVVQFFSSAGESGTLSVTHMKTRQRDELVFDQGRIIDARSGTTIGEEAVSIILRLTEGSFVFRREDKSQHPATVKQETMALLLEAHRQIDESHWAPEEPAVPTTHA